MIMAELHGKLSTSASSHEISEDVLTSNIFQLMRYLPPELGIIPFFNSVFEDNNINVSLNLSKKWKVNYYFWPSGTKRGREPDVLLYLKSEEAAYIFVIEAKYYSGPSDFEEKDEKTGRVYGNQLSDEYIDLLNREYRGGRNSINVNAPQKNCFLLYLTKHYVKPKEDINKATAEFQENSPENKYKIENHLLWSNWTKIWSVLRSIEIEKYPFNLIRNDLINLLERKGFKEFSGFMLDYWARKYSSYYTEIWFDFDLRVFKKENAKFFSDK